MYARSVDGQTLSLGVSGSLWKDALIMHDRQTGSLWTQVTGEALRGPLEGMRLRKIPSVMTTWGRWKREHPDTLALVRDEEEVRPDHYHEYQTSEKIGIFATKNPDERLGGKHPILGLAPDQLGEHGAVAYVMERFDLLQDEVAGRPIVVVADPEQNVSGRIFLRSDGESVLTFQHAGGRLSRVVDEQTGTIWNLLEGVAVEGPLSGHRLETIPSVPAYWFAWAAFYPGSQLRPPAE